MNDVFETCSQAALVQRNMGQMQVVRRTCACRRDVPKGLVQKRVGTLAMGGDTLGAPMCCQRTWEHCWDWLGCSILVGCLPTWGGAPDAHSRHCWHSCCLRAPCSPAEAAVHQSQMNAESSAPCVLWSWIERGFIWGNCACRESGQPDLAGGNPVHGSGLDL